jgi:hypothetical protein
MPRFFFNLYNDITAIDDEGEEFPDLAAAREHGLCETREIAAESVRNGSINLTHYIDIADGCGEVFERIRFGDAVEIQR